MKNKFFLLAITFCLPIHSQGVSKSFIPMAEIPAGSFYMGSDGLGSYPSGNNLSPVSYGNH